ncbi:MAG: efflux RND transporter periplasmic adaptor subunit [candidate division FCPU426 bacterium]
MKDKKRIAIPIVILLLAGGVVWWLLRPRPFFYAGTIEATEIILSSRVASVLATAEVKEGEEVKAGQTLLVFSGEDLKLAAALAEKEYQRGRRLLSNGTLTQAVLDQLQFKRDQAALMVDWCTVKAPQAGTILHTYREPGELVAPGMQLLTLGDLSEVWAYIYVEQPMLSDLSLGQAVKGILPEMPGKSWTGKIALIRDQAEFTPKNVQTRSERSRLVYGVKIVFENADRVLKPGMTIEVRLPDANRK